MSPKDVTEFDRVLGARIREKRQLSGMSQARLGQVLGVSFQQVQKYENGVNRMTVARLVQAAAALGCQPGDFLDGLEP